MPVDDYNSTDEDRIWPECDPMCLCVCVCVCVCLCVYQKWESFLCSEISTVIYIFFCFRIYITWILYFASWGVINSTALLYVCHNSTHTLVKWTCNFYNVYIFYIDNCSISVSFPDCIFHTHSEK